jgi:phosphoribosylformimino-5-aminoimidazole carboxamide ribotide isomerase
MFRPCIDLHAGKVKQIVGASLSDAAGAAPQTHFISDRPARFYAELYRNDDLRGGHVIQLGPGNTRQAQEALAAFPGGLQLGGGVNGDNAIAWIDAGASHVIVTSWVFHDGLLDRERLACLEARVGSGRLVLDLSCRRDGSRYRVMTDRWQKPTRLILDRETMEDLSGHCAEFLVHAIDVEGLCRGVDLELVQQLADWSPIPVTYAGGARSIEDLMAVTSAGNGRVDLTIGSALDLFGGTGVRYAEAVAFNRRLQAAPG